MAAVFAGSGDDAGRAAALGYRPRRPWQGVAAVVGMHLLLAWALVSGLARQIVEVVRAPIEARLIEEAKVEPPPPPALVPPPAPPQVVLRIQVPEVTAVVPPPSVPQSVPAPPPPVLAPQATTPAPPGPAIHLPPPPPPMPTVSQATPEQLYAARLLEYVNGIKRYPTSREARQLRPEGTVRIWLEIGRDGELLDSGVEASSQVLLLDQEALRTVRNGRFPPIPANAYAGKPRHRFVVAMEYLRPGN